MSRARRPLRRGRRLWVSLGVGVALLSLAGWALIYKSAPPPTGHPSLKAAPEQIDLGDVKLGQTVDVAFELTNVGDGPLTITDEPYIEVVAGC